MREILFRGKRIAGHRDNTEDGTMMYGSLFVDKKGQPKIKWYDEHFGTAMTSNVDPDTVGQFTGLLDKNSKKIFEGDILRYQRDMNRYDSMIVVWNESTASLVMAYSNDMYYYETLMNTHMYCEVIGNIHDNTELL